MRDPLSGAPIDHISTGGLLTNSQVAKVLDRISDIARRDVLQGGGSGLQQDGVPSGAASLNGTMLGKAPGEIPLGQPMSPEGVPLEAPSAETLPLKQRGRSRLDVTPTITRAGAAAARPLLRRKQPLEIC